MKKALCIAVVLLFLPEAGWAVKGNGQASFRRYLKRGRHQVKKSHYPDLWDDSYREMRTSAVTLLKELHPSKHYIIGVGRSPAELASFLQAMGENVACQIPMSAMKTMPASRRHREFYRHFDKLIPQEVLASGRTLVMVDLVGSGKSLHNTRRMVEKYLRHKGVKVKVLTVGDSDGREGYVDRVVDDMVLEADCGQDVAQFVGGRDDGGHEIGKVGGRWEDLTPNPDHEAYIKQARAYMAADRELDSLLKKHFGGLSEDLGEAELPRGSRGERWNIPSGYISRAKTPDAGPMVRLKRKNVYHQLLTHEEYTAYRGAAQELMLDNAPRDHLFLGVGRSSTPIVAVLQNLDPDLAAYLPIDNKKELGPKDQMETSWVLDEYLPDAAWEGKTLVLVQKDEGGRRLAHLKKRLRAHFKDNDAKVKVKAVAISAIPTVAGVKRIDSSQLEALQQLDGQSVKLVAPYARHIVSKDDVRDRDAPRPRYQEFCDRLWDRMEPDRDLHDFLAAAAR